MKRVVIHNYSSNGVAYIDNFGISGLDYVPDAPADRSDDPAPEDTKGRKIIYSSRAKLAGEEDISLTPREAEKIFQILLKGAHRANMEKVACINNVNGTHRIESVEELFELYPSYKKTFQTHPELLKCITSNMDREIVARLLDDKKGNNEIR